jgi:hypothetical protein
MNWKLRIPLMIFVFGFISGIHQYYPNIIIFQENDFLRSVQYIGTLGIIIYLLEKTEINEKKIHFLVGIVLIFAGFVIDYLMIR